MMAKEKTAEDRIRELEQENIELRKSLLEERVIGLTAQVKLGEALLAQAKHDRDELK
jgi:hypothetical protein